MSCARWTAALALVLVAMLFAGAGCGKKKDEGPGPIAQAKDKPDDKKGGHKHEGWWCEEHGIPEEMCSLCSPEVAAKLKKEGDWCKIHDRAQSQCFKCDPSKYAKFEAMFEAKYGKKPPRPPEEQFSKN